MDRTDLVGWCGDDDERVGRDDRFEPGADLEVVLATLDRTAEAARAAGETALWEMKQVPVDEHHVDTVLGWLVQRDECGVTEAFWDAFNDEASEQLKDLLMDGEHARDERLAQAIDNARAEMRRVLTELHGEFPVYNRNISLDKV